MARFPNPYNSARPYDVPQTSEADAGAIARFFNAVYAWMAAGLALTALVAWWVSTQPNLVAMVRSGPILIGLVIAQLVLVFTISAATEKLNAMAATALFLLYSALNGLTLSVLFLVYTEATLSSAFLITAGMFGGMSLFGFVTKRDLTGLGSLLFMALIGLVIASVVSIFWRNDMLTTIINYAGVLIFVGLTAYDTQRLKAVALATAHDARAAARYSVNGALTLYLDFLNLFLFLVRILGRRE